LRQPHGSREHGLGIGYVDGLDLDCRAARPQLWPEFLQRDRISRHQAHPAARRGEALRERAADYLRSPTSVVPKRLRPGHKLLT